MRIPVIDLRRIVVYGPCQAPGPFGQLLGRPCSCSSYQDDIHFTGCPQAPHSASAAVLEWR